MATYKQPQKWKLEEGEKLRRKRETRSNLLILDLKDGKF